MSAIEPSYLGGSGGMLPRQILKTGTSKNAIIASKTLKCDRKVNQNLRVQIVRNFFLPRNLCRNFFSWPSALHEFFFRCDSSAGNFFFNSSNPPPKIKWSTPKGAFTKKCWGGTDEKVSFAKKICRTLFFQYKKIQGSPLWKYINLRHPPYYPICHFQKSNLFLVIFKIICESTAEKP